MSTLTFTVSGVSYPIYHGNGTQQQNMFQLVSTYEMRDILTITVIDSPGTAVFVRGQPVVLSDSVLGTLYTGYVHADRPEKQSPDPTITTLLHTITCMDLQYLVDKRSNSQNYANWYAGDIVTNMANSILAPEGVGITAAMRYDSTTAMFNQGINVGTVGSTSIPTNAGNLVLAPAGSAVTITEATTADFSSGTLTNVAAANNSLAPTTVSAIKFQSSVTINLTNNSIYEEIWSGSMIVGTLDTLHYDIWINAASPSKAAGVDLIFSDGTTLSAVTSALDQNGLAASPSTDLSTYASGQWYSRTISFPSSLNGKTINTVEVAFTSASAGQHTAYFKNIYLGSQSGSPFFSTTATATQVNPPVTLSANGFSVLFTNTTVAAVFDGTNNSRVSTAHSIDAVKLLASSSVTWNAVTPGTSTVSLQVSYDGGTTWQPCTINTALPALPVGSNVAGDTLTVKESFSPGTDPTFLPSLLSVSIVLNSAPNAAKSDIVTTFASQSAWNTGTHSGTQAMVSGDLEPASYSRNWNDNLITSQTFFHNLSCTQAATGGQYTITVPVDLSTYGNAVSRLDFLGSLLDFTLDVDVTFPNTFNNSSAVGIYYRTTYWDGNPGTQGYKFLMDTVGAFFARGSNAASGSGAAMTSVSQSFTAGTTYHLTFVIQGSSHAVYLNHSTTPLLTANDGVFLVPGQIGLHAWTYFQNPNGSPNSGTATFDNLVVSPIVSSTWTGPSTSISSLGTCGPSVISWTEVNTGKNNLAALTVQSSVDGGSTYQVCTNGSAIPNLPAGTNVSGKSVQIKIAFQATSQVVLPIMRQLVWRVLGAYPGASGTRTTLPLGYDTFTRANGSVWGTADDTQTWVKSGTGTVAISSNTATISNTTGDVDELLGSRTATDQEDTFLVKVSNSATSAGTKLRYTSSTKYYKLALSTTGLSIIKNTGSGESTLATTAGTYLVNTWYYLRFRVVGSGPINLYGKVWLGDGSTVEPGVINGVISPLTPMWTVQATD